MEYGRVAGELAIDSTVALGAAEMEARLSTTPEEIDDNYAQWLATFDEHHLLAHAGSKQGEILIGLAERTASRCAKGPKRGVRVPLTENILPLPFGPQHCTSSLATECQTSLASMDILQPAVRQKIDEQAEQEETN